MKNPLLLLLAMAVVLPLLAAPGSLLAEPAPLVVHQNDFTARTSLEPIGGLTTGSYRPGELVSNRVGDTGQDSWVRRHGDKAATVVEHDGNRYVTFSRAGSNTGFVCQPIGATVSKGTLRVSIDLLAPSSWTHARSPQARVALGDRVLHSYNPPGEHTILDHMARLFGFGAKEDTQTPVRFCAYDRAFGGARRLWRRGRKHQRRPRGRPRAGRADDRADRLIVGRSGEEGRHALTASCRWNGRLSYNHARFDVPASKSTENRTPIMKGHPI